MACMRDDAAACAPAPLRYLVQTGTRGSRQERMIKPESVKALLFDVFGTCVDWRGSIIKEGPERHKKLPKGFDWAAFADAWRAMYQPAMERVRSGERPF